MSRFCLVRHGQTDWNREGRYHGQRDVPLNAEGRKQARTLAQQLLEFPFSAIYSSDLCRARETAEIIAAVIHTPLILEPRLREINQGAWEGQLVETIKDRYAELWSERTIDPINVRPPGGETLAEVAGRVYSALDDIAKVCSTHPIMICSHGLALATVICKARNLSIEHAYTIIPDNTTPIWVDWV